MSHDTRSQAERHFDQFGGEKLDPQELIKLIVILKAERDAWLDNCKTLERERLKNERATKLPADDLQ